MDRTIKILNCYKKILRAQKLYSPSGNEYRGFNDDTYNLFKFLKNDKELEDIKIIEEKTEEHLIKLKSFTVNNKFITKFTNEIWEEYYQQEKSTKDW
jgi:hypothetical protein